MRETLSFPLIISWRTIDKANEKGGTMTSITISSRELSQDIEKARETAKQGPVFITDRGRPAHVLLSIEEYRQMVGDQPSIVALLAMPGDVDIEFDPPCLQDVLYKQ